MNQVHNQWQLMKFGEVARFVNGYAFKPTDWQKKGLPIIRIQNLNDNGKDFNYFDGECDERYLVRNGDILISWSASLGVYIWTRGKAVLNQHIFKVIPDEKIVDHDFFYYIAQTKLAEMSTRVHGSTMKHITKDPFLSLEIPVPPMHVQRRIVAILRKADVIKNKRAEANQILQKIPQALFMHMFEKDFKTQSLEQICYKICDGTHVTPNYTESGIPFLRVTDLTESNLSKKYISEKEHKELVKRCKPEKNDILYSKNGTIGIARLVDWDYEFSIFVSLCLMKVRKEVVRPKYVESFLNTPYALRQATLHSKKGTITNLHLCEIKKIRIPVPPLKLQDEFILRTQIIDTIIGNQEKSTEQISQLYDSLSYQAFEGYLRL